MTADDIVKCLWANSSMTSQVGGFQNPGVCLQAFPSIFPHPLSALLLAPFFAWSLTLVPRSLLLNRTETLATQAKGYLKRSCGNRKKTPREQEEGKPHGADCRQLAGYLSTRLARRLLARS